MLKVKNLIKDYSTGFLNKQVRVLKGVNFTVNEGEIFGFVGPNGAGKTTTFKSILGFINITSGSIEIMNKPHTDVENKKNIGYLPENPYFYDYLTGEELLHYMGELHGINKDILSARVNKLLEKVNIAHAKKMQLRKYSKGMLQRIGIAQALINDPELLILDEPMSGLDPIGRREIKDLILEQKQKGKTILLSSHMLVDVEALCDRVGLIVRGEVVKIGPIADLLAEIHTDYEIIAACTSAQIENHIKHLEVDIEPKAGFISIKFDEDIKQGVLDILVKIGIDVISLHPLRKSLEGFFVEETTKNDPEAHN